MKLLDNNAPDLVVASWVWVNKSDASAESPVSSTPLNNQPSRRSFDLLRPLRHWIDRFNIRSPKAAHSICRLIPAQCPFERDIRVLGRTILHIPPLCKLNPIYEELVGLRFRALCYLADECGEDVSAYC